MLLLFTDRIDKMNKIFADLSPVNRVNSVDLSLCKVHKLVPKGSIWISGSSRQMVASGKFASGKSKVLPPNPLLFATRYLQLATQGEINHQPPETHKEPFSFGVFAAICYYVLILSTLFLRNFAFQTIVTSSIIHCLFLPTP